MGIRLENVSLVAPDAENIGAGMISKIEHLGVDGVITLQLATETVIKAKTRKHVEMRVGNTMGVDVRNEDALLYVEGALAVA